MAKDPYSAEPYWKHKRLTPYHLQIHEIFVDRDNELDIDQLLTADVVPSTKTLEQLPDWPVAEYGSSSERHRLRKLQEEFGWMSVLRKNEADQTRQCRWM